MDELIDQTQSKLPISMIPQECDQSGSGPELGCFGEMSSVALVVIRAACVAFERESKRSADVLRVLPDFEPSMRIRTESPAAQHRREHRLQPLPARTVHSLGDQTEVILRRHLVHS